MSHNDGCNPRTHVHKPYILHRYCGRHLFGCPVPPKRCRFCHLPCYTPPCRTAQLVERLGFGGNWYFR